MISNMRLVIKSLKFSRSTTISMKKSTIFDKGETPKKIIKFFNPKTLNSRSNKSTEKESKPSSTKKYSPKVISQNLPIWILAIWILTIFIESSLSVEVRFFRHKYWRVICVWPMPNWPKSDKPNNTKRRNFNSNCWRLASRLTIWA